MIEDSDLGYNIYKLDEFEFDYGRVLRDVDVEYTTSGTPVYDDKGNIVNAVIFCHKYDGNYSSITDLNQLIGPDSKLADFNFFYISISSLGHPNSCSPSTTNLKYDFPGYSFKNVVDFKRKFLAEKFNIKKVLGVMGIDTGGYEVYTWACEYPDEMEFIIIGNSTFKTHGYLYIASKVIDSMIESSDAYYDDVYSDSLSKIMVSINRLIYSKYFSKKLFKNLSNFEIDTLMDDFVDDGLFADIYDLKYRNDAILNYDVEDKLSDIKAKTLIIAPSDDIYFIPEFDLDPLKDKIENLEIFIFNIQDFDIDKDYPLFYDVAEKFLNEFRK